MRIKLSDKQAWPGPTAVPGPCSLTAGHSTRYKCQTASSNCTFHLSTEG